MKVRLRLWMCVKGFGRYLQCSISEPNNFPIYLTFLATAFLAGFAYFAWDESTRSTKVFQEQLGILRGEDRPLIWLAKEKFEPPVLLPTNIDGIAQVGWNISFSNFGKSPALDLRVVLFIKLARGEFVRSRGSELGPILGAPLVPGIGSFGTAVSQEQKMTSEDFDQLMTTDNGISAKAIIDYRDAAGVPYETSICLTHLHNGATAQCDGSYIR